VKLVILDRDGVINHDSSDFIKAPEEWTPIPGSLEAIARLCREDYRVVVATNQSGVARGYFDLATMNKIHARMIHRVRQKGGAIDAIFFCPHGPDDDCDCRKPLPGMFHGIATRLKTGLGGVPAVGDSLRDLDAAEEAGAMPVLVLSGKNELDLAPGESIPERQHIPVFEDLAEFTDALLDGYLDDKIRKGAV